MNRIKRDKQGKQNYEVFLQDVEEGRQRMLKE
jgi:hypothetical protein